MVAVPLLGGALLRLVLGLLTDHIGARRTGILGMALTTLPLLLGWLWADSFDKMLLVGLLLGVAGASFAAALPLASRWYPPRYQGLAMGIAGAGNSGTALATFFGPRLAQVWGWHAVFGLALDPAAGDACRFLRLRQGQPQPAGAAAAGGLRRRAPDARHLVVLPVLLDHVRRLRRAGQLPERLLPEPVRALQGPGGQLRHALRHRRLVPAAAGRLPRRPLRRRPDADWAVPRRGRDHARAGDAAAAGAGTLAVVRGHGAAGHGQRRRVPARPAAVPQGDRRDDRHRRGRRRAWAASCCRPCWAP